MFVFVDALTNLDEFIRNKATLPIIGSYYLAMFPLVVNQILPAAALISALFVIGRMNQTNEITAMRATGISGVWIAAPILVIGLVLSIGVLALQETVAPQASVVVSSIRRSAIQGKGSNLENQSLKNVAVLSSNFRMIYARELNLKTKTIYDVIILQHFPDLTLKSKTAAKKAVWSNGRWTLYDTVHYELDPQGNFKGKPETLPQKPLYIDEAPEDFIRQHKETQFMNYMQLKKHIDNSGLAGFKTSNRLLVDLHKKIASPFTCFIILLLGLPIALQPRRRGSAMMSVGLGFSVIAVYYLSIAVIAALGKGAILPPLLAAWLPHVVFLIIGVRSLYKRL